MFVCDTTFKLKQKVYSPSAGTTWGYRSSSYKVIASVYESKKWWWWCAM